MQKYRKIIMIVIDTLNVDHLGCYGYKVPRRKTTPFLDSVAERGALFQNCYATDVPTPSSFTSLFYGVRGIKHGIIGFNNLRTSEFSCKTPSLAECFSKKGFRTGMISNLLYLGPWFARGFQDIYPPGLRFQSGTAEEVTGESIQWLKNYAEKDFFLFVHYWDPHVPYYKRSKEEYRKIFSAKEYKDFAPDMRYFQHNRFLRMLYDAKHKKEGDPLDPEENLALYDANIRYVDDNIKVLMDNLEELGIKDKVLTVITSDHGEAFGEYGFFDHYSSYRNISQLPLIVFGPGIESRKISAYTQNVDIMPTVLELAGVDVPEGLCGRSVVPLLQGGKDSFREEIVVNSDATVIQRMYIRDDYALMHTLSAPVWEHIKEYELFNLSHDPNQVKDISSEERGRTSKMRLALDEWLTEQLKGASDPLQLSLLRGGWMWKLLLRLLDYSNLQKMRERYPTLKTVFKNLSLDEFM